MPEPHRLSYMGDPALVESFLEILARHGLVHIPDAAPAATPEPGMDYDASDPYSIVASGSYDTASTDIAHAIADFTTRFPGRARIYDGGAMPSGGLLTFRGRHELIDDFYPLLAFEDVEVMDPQEDDDWASVDQQIEADPTGDAAIEMQVIGGKDLPRHVVAAVAAFLRQHPGQAEIEFESDP